MCRRVTGMLRPSASACSSKAWLSPSCTRHLPGCLPDLWDRNAVRGCSWAGFSPETMACPFRQAGLQALPGQTALERTGVIERAQHPCHRRAQPDAGEQPPIAAQFVDAHGAGDFFQPGLQRLVGVGQPGVFFTRRAAPLHRPPGHTARRHPLPDQCSRPGRAGCGSRRCAAPAPPGGAGW